MMTLPVSFRSLGQPKFFFQTNLNWRCVIAFLGVIQTRGCCIYKFGDPEPLRIQQEQIRIRHPGPWLDGLGPPRKLKKRPSPKRLNLHIFAIGLNSHLIFTYLRRITFPKPGL